MAKPKEQGLAIEIRDDVLTISIGIGTLVVAIEGSDFWWEMQEDDPSLAIVDPRELTKDIVDALEAEEDDGTTLVHRLIDAAARAAIENGSLGVHGENDD